MLNAVVCSRVRGLQKALSAGTIALEISSRNARVTALPKRWDRLRASLDLIRDQRGRTWPICHAAPGGLLCRDYKGNPARPRIGI